MRKSLRKGDDSEGIFSPARAPAGAPAPLCIPGSDLHQTDFVEDCRLESFLPETLPHVRVGFVQVLHRLDSQSPPGRRRGKGTRTGKNAAAAEPYQLSSAEPVAYR